MPDVFVEFIHVLVHLLTWPAVGFVLLGVLIGLIFGSIPGLGGPIAIALLIPITFGMNTENALILLGATLGGVAFGGSISAIILNIPGTAPNAATCLDGYPMSQQGRAAEALGISATASALGAIFGVVVLLGLIPFARGIILAFGPANMFWLAVFGLTVIASVSRGSVPKGLLSGGLGLLLAFIGFSGLHGTYRFGFGTRYLREGIQIVPVVIGLFAIAEVINLTAKGGIIASHSAEATEARREEGRREVFVGVRQVFKHPRLFFQSSIIGTVVGLIPGAGGIVANFISYMQARVRSADPASFGTGTPAGVIASEAANDAKDGGSILPTFAFGIPGSVAMAVLLGGLMIHGVTPGRELMGENIGLLLLLIGALLLSNVFSSTIGIVLASPLTKLTRIDVHHLAPPILTISVVGAFAVRHSIGDVLLAVAFGIIGFLMISYAYSRIPLLLALILAPIAEQGFFQAIQISDVGYLIFVSDPISIMLLIFTVASIAFSTRIALHQRIDMEEI